MRKVSEEVGQSDHAGHVERGRAQHNGERRSIDQREQGVDVEKVALQSVHDQVRQVSHLQADRAPAQLVLLPAVLIQEGHLLHVRRQDTRDQELSTNVGLKLTHTNAQMAAYGLFNFCFFLAICKSIGVIV